jgi:hypothetical protein
LIKRLRKSWKSRVSDRPEQVVDLAGYSLLPGRGGLGDAPGATASPAVVASTAASTALHRVRFIGFS